MRQPANPCQATSRRDELPPLHMDPRWGAYQRSALIASHCGIATGLALATSAMVDQQRFGPRHSPIAVAVAAAPKPSASCTEADTSSRARGRFINAASAG